MRIAAGGIVVVHERLIPQALRHIQRFIAQLVGDLSSLVVLADGVGAGGEQTIDRVLFVLLLLPHHGAVLPAGHAGILGRNAIAVFRHVAVGGEKVCPAAATPAGRMAVLQSVHQVKDVEADGMVKEIPVYKYGFLFLFRVSGKDIGGSQIRCNGEWLDIRYRQITHHIPEPFTVEAVVGGHGEEGFRPLLQPPQIALLKISCRHGKVLDAQGDAEGSHQIAEEKFPSRRSWLQQIVVGCRGKHHLQCVLLLPFVHQAVRWTVPQGIQQLFQRGAGPVQQLNKFTSPGQSQGLHLMADGAAVGDQFPYGLIGNIQQFGGKVAGRVDGLVEKDLILPDIHCQVKEIVVLPDPQWHRATSSVLYLFSDCLAIFSFYQNPPNNQVKGQEPRYGRGLCPYLFYKGMILMSKTKRLQTIDGESLMSLPLTPLNFVLDTLLSQGLHILAGSPKVGKSWLALWLAVMVAKGEPVWGMSVKQGTTLYLCLEDSVLRIQNRLFEITEDAPSSVHFCTECALIGQGLEEQVETFLTAHPDTVLVIIDTLQMVRPARDATYANDYRDLSALKQIADAHGIAILLIHHLRKESADDVFNRISGTTAISGAVDSSFTLVEERRGSGRAKLSCIGRDIEYRELTLERNGENVWELVSDSRTQPELLGDRIVYLLSELMHDQTEFIGTPTELSERIDPVGVERMSPKKVSRQILQNLDALRKIGISAVVRRSNGRRLIELQRAESDDTQGVPAVDPVDPAGALCSDLRAVYRCGE